MEINGIKIRDIKDAQDVLAALVTIISKIESINADLETNQASYNNTTYLIADQTSAITEQQKISKKTEELIQKTKKIIEDPSIAVHCQSYEKKLIDCLDQRILVFDSELKKMEINQNNMNALNEEMNSLIKYHKKDVLKSIDNFNSIGKTISKQALFMSFALGALCSSILVKFVL